MTASWFYLIMLATVFMTFMVSIQQFTLATLAVNFAVAVFPEKIPAVAWPFIGLLNIFAIAVTLFYKPLSPALDN
jgi:hypothetical protein